MLTLLKEDPLGRVFLANAHSALEYSSTLYPDYLKSCNQYCQNNSPINAAQIIQAVNQQSYFFKRTPSPILFDDISTVVSLEKLNSRAIPANKILRLLNKERTQKLVRQVRSRTSIAPAIIKSILNDLSNPEHIKPDVTIGEEQYPLWIAASSEIDEVINLANKASHTKKSDAVRDALGLNINANVHLIRLTMSKENFKSHLDSTKSPITAPTFIEAWTNPYFRSSSCCSKNWGYTRHLTDDTHTGIREAVTKAIPYTLGKIKIEYLEQTTISPTLSTQDHADFILGKRTWNQIVTDLQAILNT